MKTLWIGVLTLFLTATALPVQAQPRGNCAGQVSPNGQCLGGPPSTNVVPPKPPVTGPQVTPLQHSGSGVTPQPQLPAGRQALPKGEACRSQCGDGSGKAAQACLARCAPRP